MLSFFCSLFLQFPLFFFFFFFLRSIKYISNIRQPFYYLILFLHIAKDEIKYRSCSNRLNSIFNVKRLVLQVSKLHREASRKERERERERKFCGYNGLDKKNCSLFLKNEEREYQNKYLKERVRLEDNDRCPRWVGGIRMYLQPPISRVVAPLLPIVV